MIRYLLDKNILVELIRSRPAPLLAKLRRRKIGTIGISVITLVELQFGVAKSSDRAKMRSPACPPNDGSRSWLRGQGSRMALLDSSW